jgi:hypothetical protein
MATQRAISTPRGRDVLNKYKPRHATETNPQRVSILFLSGVSFPVLVRHACAHSAKFYDVRFESISTGGRGLHRWLQALRNVPHAYRCCHVDSLARRQDRCIRVHSYISIGLHVSDGLSKRHTNVAGTVHNYPSAADFASATSVAHNGCVRSL